MFYVGQKVECIEAPPLWWRNRHSRLIYPELGAKFTVLAVTHGRSRAGLILEGLPTPNELGWAANYFRPIVEKKTDISIFTEMLNVKELNNV